MKEFEQKRAPRPVRRGLSLGAGLLLLAGLLVGSFLQQVSVGVLFFALGGILFAIRGYLNTGDKVVTGAVIFVALAAIAIQAVVHFLGP